MKIPVIILFQILILLPSSLCFGSALHKPIRPQVAKMTALEASVSPSDSYLSMRGGASEVRILPIVGGLLKKSFQVTKFATLLAHRIYKVFFELFTGGFLKPQAELPYGKPLGGNETIIPEIRELGVRERNLIFTKSLRVYGREGTFCKIWRKKFFSKRDRFEFFIKRDHVATLHYISETDSFDILRGKSEEKIGRLEKSDDTGKKFLIYAEPSGNATETAVEEEKPMYTLKGDIIKRRFTMRNAKHQCVAKIRDQIFDVPRFNYYRVRVAPGMDPMMVQACVCAINTSLFHKDEEDDDDDSDDDDDDDDE